MGTPRRLMIIVVFVVAWLPRETAAAIPVDRQQPIGVRVADLAGVPRAITTRAVLQAARVFQKIGVTIVWDESPDTRANASGHAFLVQINLTPDEAESSGDWVLGSATPGAQVSVVSVFYRDVQLLAEQQGVPPELLCGYVIAHELGHILLGPRAHRSFGLMRPSWNRNDMVYGVAQGQFQFTAEEAARIRNRLQ